MMTLLIGLLLTAVIVVALYAFGVFNTPILDAFRVRPFICCWFCSFSPYGSASGTSHTKDRTPPLEPQSEEGITRAGRSEVVVVTGASAGIGRAIVREFARHGASLGLLARSRDGLAGARHDAQRLGGRAHGHRNGRLQ